MVKKMSLAVLAALMFTQAVFAAQLSELVDEIQEKLAQNGAQAARFVAGKIGVSSIGRPNDFFKLWNPGSNGETLLLTLVRYPGQADNIKSLYYYLSRSLPSSKIQNRLADKRFSGFESLEDYMNAQDANGNTALHIAANAPYEDALKALLNPDFRDPAFTPFTAEAVTKENNTGDTPISLAAGNDKLSEDIQMRLVDLSPQMGAPWETGIW